MPLLFILGLAFVIGCFVYYLASTSGNGSSGKSDTPATDDLRKEDNVIFLSDDIDKIKREHNIGGDNAEK